MSATKGKYTVGQRVRVFGTYGRRGEKWGVVEKVGRTLVYVRQDGQRWGDPAAYYIKDGRGREGFGHIRTEEEDAEAKRRQAAESALKERGLEISLGSGRRFSAGLLERIVEVLDEEAS